MIETFDEVNEREEKKKGNFTLIIVEQGWEEIITQKNEEFAEAEGVEGANISKR